MAAGKAKAETKAAAPEREAYRVRVRGVSVSVPKDVMDDMDMVELMADLEAGDVFAFPKIMSRMFGADYPRVKRALANEGGVTTVTSMVAFFQEVIAACNALEAKN